MAAITGTKAACTELSGEYKIVCLTATVTSADDAITISYASHGISAVDAILGAGISGGLDAAFTGIQVTKTSATIVTITSIEQDGTASTNWATPATTVFITLLGH